MMTIIVDHRDSAFHASNRETAIHACELSQPLANAVDRQIHFKPHPQSCRRIQNIVDAGKIELKDPEIFAAPVDLELAATSGEPDILNLEIHLRRSAVSDRPAANVGKNLLDVRVLHADDGGAIEWDLVN